MRDRLNGTDESLGCCISTSWDPDISFSADGRFVSDYGRYIELGARDRKSGVRQQIDRGIKFLTTFTTIISANGRFAVFGGLEDDTDPRDISPYNVFVRDLLTRTTEKLTDDPSSTKPTSEAEFSQSPPMAALWLSPPMRTALSRRHER